MALSKCLFTLVLATITGLLELAHGLEGSPKITSTTLSEVVVNPESNYTITCESDTSIIWNYPNISDSEPNVHTTQKNGKYLSSIQLTNINYKDVGYYYCLSDKENGKNASIYLYVNDTENLLTYSDMMFTPLNGLEHQDIIIPCKPTQPEVNVTLCYNSYEKLHIGENDNFGVIRYNPKLGFTLESAQIRNNGFYFCCTLPEEGTCSEEECPRSYTLGVLKHSDSVAKPAIDQSHLQHVKVTENVTIECRVTVPSITKFTLEWIIPNESDRITVENTQIDDPVSPGHHLTTRRIKLNIYNAKVEDTGNYMCKVKDHSQNTNNETVYLKIFST